MAKKSALHINKGVEDAPSINPRFRNRKVQKLDVEELATAIIQGDRAALATGITLVESSAHHDRESASNLLERIMPHTGRAQRIGVSGVPGVGKSTFLEHYGMFTLSASEEAKVAVLAVDPSSSKTKGAILGDKTRMMELGKHNRAFIRPSASGGVLGGVARATKEAILLCESAGFTHVFVETVGVGQSETLVAQLTDCFLFLAMPKTGDELQGIKKGIMEIADIIAVNKSEGEGRLAAEHSATQIKQALQLFAREDHEWMPAVELISGLYSEGFEALDDHFERFFRHSAIKGLIQSKRIQQDQFWFEQSISNGLSQLLSQDASWSQLKKELIQRIAQGELSPFEASAQLLKKFAFQA